MQPSCLHLWVVTCHNSITPHLCLVGSSILPSSEYMDVLSGVPALSKFVAPTLWDHPPNSAANVGHSHLHELPVHWCLNPKYLVLHCSSQHLTGPHQHQGAGPAKRWDTNREDLGEAPRCAMGNHGPFKRPIFPSMIFILKPWRVTHVGPFDANFRGNTSVWLQNWATSWRISGFKEKMHGNRIFLNKNPAFL